MKFLMSTHAKYTSLYSASSKQLKMKKKMNKQFSLVTKGIQKKAKPLKRSRQTEFYPETRTLRNKMKYNLLLKLFLCLF